MTGSSRIISLLGVAAFLVWLNLRYPAPNELVAVSERSAALVTGDPAGRQARQSVAPKGTQSPSAPPVLFDRPMLEPAERDPFGLLVSKPAPPVLQVRVAAPVQPVAAPPTPAAPTPPPLNMRFAGRMTAPDGTQIVVVALGDVDLAIATGQNLPNGYRVESIGARSVELRYPPLNTTARLDLPEPPKYQTR